LRISIRGVSFHRPWVFFLFCSFFLSGRFPQENCAPGSPRNDDRSVGRPVALLLFRFLGRPSACRSRSPPVSDSPRPDDRARDCTSHQHNTHIRERREICYPWHPWHGRKVWVHTTLIKRGRAVAHCSLEDVQPFRVLEVPLWMLDVAVCCKIRVVKSGLANVESLRELRALLHSAQPARGDIALEAQHRYLLDAGGADVNVADSRGTPSTPVVCSSASQAALDGSVARCSTEDSAIADAVAAAALRQTPGRGPGRGGAR
jgi:hypothetical protein